MRGAGAAPVRRSARRGRGAALPQRRQRLRARLRPRARRPSRREPLPLPGPSRRGRRSSPAHCSAAERLQPRGSRVHRPEERRGREGFAGTAAFPPPLRYCRLLLLCVRLLKPRAILEEEEDLGSKPLSLLRHPLVLLSRGSAFPREFPPLYKAYKLNTLARLFWFCYSNINLLPAVTNLDEISVNSRGARRW